MTISEKWLTMILLCLSGSLMYWLPFFSEILYMPMIKAFGFSKTEIGILLSTFGTLSLIGYLPGGWLADRFSPRKLISVALLITAAGGFVFSTTPSFKICVILHGIWGISTACIFWSALIKTTRNWGSEDEQGRTFGILEGGRNLTELVLTTAILALFAFRGGDSAAFSETIVLTSVVLLILAILVWRCLSDKISVEQKSPQQKHEIDISTVIKTLKLPMVWLIAIVVLAAYAGMWGTIFFTPYASDAYALGDVGAGAIGAGKYWIAPFAAIAAGFFADRIGPAIAVFIFFIVMTGSFLVFAVIPGTPDLFLLLVLNGGLLAGVAFALRGTYFSLLERGGVPLAVTGIATGIVSVIGYTPDIFMPYLGGVILDTYPGSRGYQYLFLMVSALSFLGLIATYVIYRKTHKAAST